MYGRDAEGEGGYVSVYIRGSIGLGNGGMK